MTVHEFDKCIIFRPSGAKVAEGFVHEFENGSMKIYTQGGMGTVVPMENLQIFVYNNVRGECKYTGVVQRVTFNCLQVDGVRLISSAQKRENTRVSKQIKYRILQAYRGNERKKLEHPLDIVILNISANGLYFNCGERLEIGFTFALTLRETARPVNLKVEVLRREAYPRSFNYGCRFVGVSDKDMDEIFRFVLHEQIIQRRRSLFY